MQSSVQYKDISQGNNNSDQCTWKNIFIFKENVVHCIDTKLTKVWTYWVTCKIETKLDLVIVMYCKLLLTGLEVNYLVHLQSFANKIFLY